MPKQNYPPSADMDIRQLQERIEALEAAAQNRVPLDTITGGYLIVQDAAGNDYLFIGKYGPAYPDGSPQYGMALYRQTGEEQVGGVVLGLFTDAPGTAAQALFIYDASGNQVFGDDALSGFGLAVPYLSFPMHRSDAANWFSTTSATMGDAFFSFPPIQQPKVVVQGYMNAPSGTNAQIQLVSGSTVIGGPITVAGSNTSVTGWSIGPVAYPAGASFAVPGDVRVQACRTAGTGTVQVAVGASFGRQS